ncbi:MAG: phosphatase PAP2 family protein [Clostridia bacterium]|nr:phosphatase PAP2 family protein [Clostridia bacterium]
MNTFELSILDAIARYLQCPFLDWLMPLVTRLGDGGIFWILLAAVLLCFPKTRKTGLSMGLALLIGFLFGNLFLKNVFARIRPYDINTGVELLVERLSDYSFPSGHTLAAFEGAVVVAIRNKRWGIPALVLAGLIAFSRLYLYVHYPSDVLAGALLGTAIAFLACHLVNKGYEKFAKQ